MADPKSPLDELNSALDAGGLPETTPDVTPQVDVDSADTQNTEVASPKGEDVREAVEIGGRLWTSAEDLDKSYRHLQSERSKAQKALNDREIEWKKYQEDHKEALEMAQYFKAHPEVHQKVSEFFQKVISGEESPKQAIKSSGLSKQDPEFKALLEWKASIEAERQEQVSTWADGEVEKEIESLRKEYKLDDDKLDQVLAAAARFNKNLDANDDWVPLKDVYLMLASKHAWRKAARIQDTALPTPRSETIVPTSTEPRTRTAEDDLMKSLDKMGL